MHDCGSGPCSASLKPQHLPFYLQPLFELSINTPISIYSINILVTLLLAVALLRGLVGSMWQVNDNYYITLLKFRLIGIRDQFSFISLPPAGAQMSVFHSKAQTACSTVTLYFVFWPDTLGQQFTRFSTEYPHITPAADRMRARALLPW